MRMYKQKDLLEKRKWDVLLILDACRLDCFNYDNEKTFPCNTFTYSTDQWYQRYWNEEYEDIILISGHPKIINQKLYKGFYRFVDIDNLVNHKWYDPKPALDVLIDLQREHNKKFLVHLIPPHLPYIGEKGKKFMKEVEADTENTYNIYKKVNIYGLKNGWKKPKECYQESIDKSLNIIERYIPKIKGDIVITSDHGEIIGNYEVYNHNIPILENSLVPWCEI